MDTYLRFLLKRSLSLLGPCLVLSHGHITLMFAHGDRITTVFHVLCTQFQSLRYPAEDAAKDGRVVVDLLFLHTLDHPLLEAQFLVHLKVIFTLTEGIVLGHALEEVLSNQLLRLLEVQFVRITLTDHLTVVFQQIEEDLEHSGHLKHVQVLQVVERLLPVLGRQRHILFFHSISAYTARVRGA